MLDNSNQYFNMCDKAIEIQEIFRSDKEKLKEISYILDSGKTTWLPSQEQLQEMVKDDLLSLLRDFVLFVKQCFQASKVQFTSMQQLWLAYVMKKKYNKIFDNNKWVAV